MDEQVRQNMVDFLLRNTVSSYWIDVLCQVDF